MWKHIVGDQLQVPEAEFWACVRNEVLPDRGVRQPDVEALPAEVANLLINRVGVAETDVMAMSKQQAIDRLNQYWARGT